MTQVTNLENIDSRWGLAASIDADEFIYAAKKLIDDKRWAVLEGDDGFSALIVGEGDADAQLAAAFMARSNVKVYLLDFDDEAPSIVEYNEGARKRHRGHPAAFLASRGIVAPGYERGSRPSPIRSVLILEGTRPKAAKKIGFDSLEYLEHPRGTLVLGDPGLFTHYFVEKFGGPIYALFYDTEDGRFWCMVNERGKPTRRFGAETLNPELYAIVANILGETTLEGICRVLEIPLEALTGE
jgi:hypothetical protein